MERKLLSLPIFKQNFSILFECIIFLREKCVGVKLLSISCSCVTLHSLAFSDVSQSRVQSRDLGGPQKVKGFTLTQMFSRVSHA